MTKRELAAELDRARQGTEELLAGVPEDALSRQHSSLMSPLVWDYAHIGYFEELWLLRALDRADATDPRFDDLYDAFRHERSERGGLPILAPADAAEFCRRIRERSLAVLESVRLDDDVPLLRDGFVYRMVVQHELQHQETMLQTLQIAGIALPGDDERPVSPPPADAEVELDGGTFAIGTDGDPWAYDNERPAHERELAPFAIERFPVTNARWLEFVEDGGYRAPALWSPEGWAWVRDEGAEAPLYWRRTGDGWLRRRFGREEPVPPGEPVQHVSWYEADAFARWAAKRLPTELEWERAAAGAEPGNVGREARGPLPVGERSVADTGCACVLGDVWEWTSSPFEPYPGFRAFPYAEYSEVFFGDAFRVLRGGSWATDAIVARPTFRNWDYPQRRQIFSGVRLARDL